MKKLLPLLVLAVLLCPVAAPAAGETFTLMIYLCGTDLETNQGSATDDLLEMIDAGLDLGGPVTVLVETGGTSEWWIESIASDKNERMVVGDGDLYGLEILPRRDMASPDTLADFVAFGVREYPADRYGLILWNHGGGSTTGICFDEYTKNFLTASDVRDALTAASRDAGDFRLDFIGFDACLMATFEMASYVKDYADYMLASEELTPSYGFDYGALLSALREDPGIDTQALGRIVCDSYVKTNLRYDADTYATLSLLDLSKMDALTTAVESLGSGLSAALDSGQLRGISRGRQGMRSFGDFDGVSSDMVDLGHFIDVFAGLSGTDAAPLRRALSDVVAYNRYTAETLDNISGLSILLPLSTRASFEEYSKSYDPLTLYPAYADFLAGYVGMLDSGWYAFTPATPQQASGIPLLSAPGGGSTPTQGFVRVDEADEAEAAAPAADEDAFGADGVLTYSLALSDEDMEYLAYVEGNLMLDISDDEMEAYVDLGYLQHTTIDWNSGVVYSQFDGTWPILEGQAVHMVDQIITGRARRSLIDVTVNGMDVYLLVVFDDARPGGAVIGYTEGYNEHGIPARGYEKLSPGDEIIPQYYLYYYDDDGEEYIERFEGEPIIYDGMPLSFGYESIAGEDMDFAYTFCLNDIFGDYSFSDFIFFAL